MDKVTYQIRTAIGTSLPLTGKGLEQIVDPITGEAIAQFWNGNLETVSPLSQHTEASARLMEESTLLLEAA